MNGFLEGLWAQQGPHTSITSQSTLSSELTWISNRAWQGGNSTSTAPLSSTGAGQRLAAGRGLLPRNRMFRVNVAGEHVYSPGMDELFLLPGEGSSLLSPSCSHLTSFLPDDSPPSALVCSSVSPDGESLCEVASYCSPQHQAQCLASDLLCMCLWSEGISQAMFLIQAKSFGKIPYYHAFIGINFGDQEFYNKSEPSAFCEYYLTLFPDISTCENSRYVGSNHLGKFLGTGQNASHLKPLLW